MATLQPVGAGGERSSIEIEVDIDDSGERKAAAAWKAPAAMVLVELIITVLNILSKVVITQGMFIFALHVYRSALGTLFILPFAIIYESGEVEGNELASFGLDLPQRVIRVYGANMLILLWSAGYNAIICRHFSQYDSSCNLHSLPHFKTLRFGTSTGTLKIVGVLLAVGGTMVVSFYKGKVLHLWNSILQHHKYEHVHVANHHVRGTIILICSSFTFACWYPIQSMVQKVYPHKCWSTTASCFVGGLQSTLVGIILRRDRKSWKLGWDLQLLTIVYTGSLATAVRYNLESWVVAKRGPVYPPIFIPLITVFSVVLDSIFLGNSITVGSLLGAITVIAGLYIFLWGKSKELPRK
ncbi:hypothetical protein ACP70R_000006 [Stipagrostis hirtigluma subsp. patula]